MEIQPINFMDTHNPIDHMVAVAEKGKFSGELWYPTGIAIDENTNQIYITEGHYDSSRVSIFSEKGEFLNTFTSEHMTRPWDIQIYRDSIYVTDAEKHSVFHFKLAAKIHLIDRIGGKGLGLGEFRDPRQLAVSASGDIFVSDRTNHRIQILNRALHYEREISHQSMTYPRGVKLTSKKVYVLSDADSTCVHVFSYSGDKIRSVIPCGPGSQVREPYFLCLDANENIFISDWRTHQIKIFSKEGELMLSIGKRGHEVGAFEYPHGIVLTNNLKLATVSLNVNYSLQIFSLL